MACKALLIKNLKKKTKVPHLHTIVDKIPIALLPMVIEHQSKPFLYALRVLKIYW